MQLFAWYSNGLNDDDYVKLRFYWKHSLSQSVSVKLNKCVFDYLVLASWLAKDTQHFSHSVFTFMELNCYIYCVIYRWISMFMNRARFMVLSLQAFISWRIFHLLFSMINNFSCCIRFNHLLCPRSLSFPSQSYSILRATVWIIFFERSFLANT